MFGTALEVNELTLKSTLKCKFKNVTFKWIQTEDFPKKTNTVGYLDNNTIFVILPLYTTTMELKRSDQGVIEE